MCRIHSAEGNVRTRAVTKPSVNICRVRGRWNVCGVWWPLFDFRFWGFQNFYERIHVVAAFKQTLWVQMTSGKPQNRTSKRGQKLPQTLYLHLATFAPGRSRRQAETVTSPAGSSSIEFSQLKQTPRISVGIVRKSLPRLSLVPVAVADCLECAEALVYI